MTPPARRILAARLRLALFLLGLGVLAGTYALTRSAWLQLVVLLWLAFVARPLAARMLGRPVSAAAQRELDKLPRYYNPPLRLLVEMSVPYAAWPAFVLWALPRPDLGPGFLGWLIVVPAEEAAVWLAGRRLRRDGLRGFSRARPLRDISLMSVGLGAAMAVMTLAQGATASRALLAAVLGAGFMAAFGAGLVLYGRLRC